PARASASAPDAWPGAYPEDTAPLPTWHIGPYFGFAWNSPGGGDWGGVPGRDHMFIGVRGTAPVARWEPLTLSYAAELIPLVVVTDNPEYRTAIVIRGGVPTRLQVENGSGLVYGAGIAPLGLEARLRYRPHAQVFGAIGMGLLWFTREVPVANSRAVNYTAEMGF